MHQNVLVFPVLPGKTEADVRRLGEEFNRRPEEYRESRRRHGITFERAYLQSTPTGMYLIAYGESEAPFDAVVASLGASDLPIDKYFRDAALDLHGFDMTAPPPAGGAETIAAWNDPDVSERGAGFAFCAPLVPGRADAGRAFADDAYHRPDFAASRRAKGISKEVVSLLTGPQGDVVAVYTEGRDPAAGNAEFAASSDPFDVWFKETLATLFPPEVDFGQPVTGVTEVFDSQSVPMSITNR